ncbi:MAG TPA: hypothetical protein HA255_01560, partial [Methanosphaera sp.]|nr:hypothetical protein [Methanosphaera sp.]
VEEVPVVEQTPVTENLTDLRVTDDEVVDLFDDFVVEDSTFIVDETPDIIEEVPAEEIPKVEKSTVVEETPVV